jgi:hypothetical protein
MVRRFRSRCGAAILVLAATLLVGCASPEERAESPAEGDAGVPSGWTAVDDERRFDGETIYELVNGQADAYFAYNFEEVSVRTYTNDDGGLIDVEVWTVSSPADAYGLHTINRSGESIQAGNGGDTDPGRRIAFWQDRHYIRVRSRQDTPQETLTGFAAAVSAELPSGGEIPPIVARLPRDGLVDGSEVYFHLENSIQDYVWLGGSNILGLDLQTEGVLARYDSVGNGAWLLLIEYADSEDATRGAEALIAAEPEGLVGAKAADTVLAALFGDVPEGDGMAFIDGALQIDGD